MMAVLMDVLLVEHWVDYLVVRMVLKMVEWKVAMRDENLVECLVDN